MKFSTILPFAAITTAFVVPSEEVLSELKIEDHHQSTTVYDEVVSTKDDIVSKFESFLHESKDRAKHAWEDVSEKSQNLMDDAFSRADEVATTFGDKMEETANDLQSWLEEHNMFESSDDGHHHDGDHKRPHHPPHHDDPHHGKPNLTVYQLIAGSKYTTKLAKLINEYDDLVEALNSTAANYTIFAPTDAAFEKIPEHAHKPTKEQLKAVLSYHVVPDFYPAGRVLVSHTAPTLLKGKHLSSQEEPQRIAFKIGLRGLTVNFYSRIVAINIFGTNGVIHGVDSLLIPPPSIITLIDLFPGEFSTLELGLGKTGLLEKFNHTDHHQGGTFFAPSNWAFQKLGPRVNAFLFSQYGKKYLEALLKYHVVPKNTLYSDAYYKAKDSDAEMEEIPKGYFHVDLPTLLDDRSLSIDIGRYGGYISMKINGFSTVSVQDGIAEDGVLHVVSSVLIPPKSVGGKMVHYEGGEITEEELKERLEPFVAKMDL
ncbi:fasciclin domain family protein [Zymoseptoria brevis]|uniref:Fasciclin domain family protein n=1 Tax=Zymoseptoria brevis TaxID=1047168 RepID=A0A0F4GGK7_9PEZI|nr:fasciclin domain family protein [Zymoseptoria brevis]